MCHPTNAVHSPEGGALRNTQGAGCLAVTTLEIGSSNLPIVSHIRVLPN